MEPFLAAAVIIVMALVYLRFRNRPEQRAKRALRAVRATSIRGAPEGVLVKIVGTASPVGEALVAPLSKRPCVFHQVRVTQADGDVETDVALDPVEVDFFIEDGTGIARVEVRDVEASLREDFSAGMRAEGDLAAARAGVLGRLNIEDERGVACLEAIIPCRASVSVLGVARRPRPEDEVGTRKVDLVIESPPDAPLRLGGG